MNNLRQHDDDDTLRRFLLTHGPQVTPPAEFKQQLRQRLATHLQVNPPSSAMWRFRQLAAGWPLRRLAAAAVLLLAVGVTWWLIAGGVQTAKADFASVLRHVREAKWVSYDMTVRPPGQPEMKAHVMFARPGLVRIEWQDGRTHIYDWGQKKVLGLRSTERTGRISAITASRDPVDPLDQLRAIGDHDGVFAGTQEVEGREFHVYLVDSQSGKIRILVDPENDLPASLDVSSQQADGQSVLLSLTNLKWDEPVSDSLFSLAIPEGYTLEDGASQTALVEMLRICSTLNGGLFPPDLSSSTVFGLIRNSYTKANHASEPGADVMYTSNLEGSQLEQTVRICISGLAFADSQAGLTYAGRGVAFGETSKPICWWRSEKSQNYLAVFGDLTLKEISPAELPLLGQQ